MMRSTLECHRELVRFVKADAWVLGCGLSAPEQFRPIVFIVGLRDFQIPSVEFLSTQKHRSPLQVSGPCSRVFEKLFEIARFVSTHVEKLVQWQLDRSPHHFVAVR